MRVGNFLGKMEKNSFQMKMDTCGRDPSLNHVLNSLELFDIFFQDKTLRVLYARGYNLITEVFLCYDVHRDIIY